VKLHRSIQTIRVTSRPYNGFEIALRKRGAFPLCRSKPTTLQVNLGKRCNQACRHCHVDAGPLRREEMNLVTAERVLELLERNPALATLDLTGGAPELNPHFRHLVSGARKLERTVIDRCNLTILFEPGQEDTASFLAHHQVHVVASLPCYSRENVELQRGRCVYDKSIGALRILNELGYAQAMSGLEIDLVYNPLGPSLPPDQAKLEADYRTHLSKEFGVAFNRLLTITNMPIERFAHDLRNQDKLDAYEHLLMANFNPGTLRTLMCRTILSVGYDGRIFDCDFNQMLDMPLETGPRNIWDLNRIEQLDQQPIATDSHCFGCTAGAGSSCSGALA